MSVVQIERDERSEECEGWRVSVVQSERDERGGE